MRRILVTLTLAVWLLVPVAATASTVTLSDWTATGDFKINAPNGGGAFKAVTVGGELGNLPLGFLTFCLEFNEHFSAGGTYTYALSNTALAGGVGGGPADPVDDATKWLYYNARSGGYVDLINTVIGTGKLANSGIYIQEAIWFIEEERGEGEIFANSLKLANFVLDELALHPTLWTDLEAAGHHVYAMNLTQGTTLKQDQLVYTVPEPGTLAQLATLAPIGLLGYLAIGASRLVRRRRR